MNPRTRGVTRGLRLVVDTNQVARLPGLQALRNRRSDFEGLSLSPHVLAEILLLSNPEPLLASLRRFDIRIGWTIWDALRKASGIPIEELETFHPFLSPNDPVFDKFTDVITRPTANAVAWANEVKDSARRFSSRMLQGALEFRDKLKALREKKKKFPEIGGEGENDLVKDLNDALNRIGGGPDSFLGWITLTLLMNQEHLTTPASVKLKYHEAVLNNQYLGRFVRILYCYTLSISRLWKDYHLHFDPSLRKDDWTDLSLALYVADGDTLLTEDGRLRRLLSLAEPSGRATARPIEDI
jgi:hypothetical protein